MALDSRLANLSLGEIASLLSPKQQEVLLASISVAASFIQQLQQEEQNQSQQNQNTSNNNNNQQQMNSLDLSHRQQRQPQQHHHHHQQQQQQHQQQHHHQQQQQRQRQRQRHQQQHQLTSSMTMTPTIINETHDSLDAHETFETDETYETYDETDETNDDSDADADGEHTQQTRGSTRRESISEDEKDAKDLLIIRQFADELKHRRKAIRLSQKGAAQSLRAFTNGVQPCTDAIIYHFENLQLEPDRAMQLIPLLRDWLEWAEKHRFHGQQLPMMSAVTKVPRERKRKVVLFNEKAKQHLEDAFVKNNHPDRYQLDVISQELSIPTRSIRKWFTNRRQRKRFAEKFST